jgi:hypothetical protein
MNTPSNKLRIIVGGLVGNYPLGGVAWDYFHYVLGLAELGHDVYYHEDTWCWPLNPADWNVTDPAETMRTHTEPFFRNFFAKHAPHVQDRWHFVLLHDKTFGMSKEAFAEIARTADIYLNVSGACFFPDDLGPGCLKVFMDTDPGYNQIVINTRPEWVTNVDRWIKQVREHDRHLTYAENIFAPDCKVPRMDFDWRVTRPIVTLGNWADIRDRKPPANAPFTTVMTWKFFPGPVEHEGICYHAKVPEYDKFHDLPRRVQVPMMLAVAGEKYERDAIERDGWIFEDAIKHSLTPELYMDVIRDSAGEWSVAKNVYVGLNTGWFSCRTACYLAAGRPAVVQDTAWSRYVPSGDGLIAFTTMQEAIDGIEQVVGDPARHAEAAYEIAREYLAPDRVLTPMIETIFSTSRKPEHVPPSKSPPPPSPVPESQEWEQR